MRVCPSSTTLIVCIKENMDYSIEMTSNRGIAPNTLAPNLHTYNTPFELGSTYEHPNMCSSCQNRYRSRVGSIQAFGCVHGCTCTNKTSPLEPAGTSPIPPPHAYLNIQLQSAQTFSNSLLHLLSTLFVSISQSCLSAFCLLCFSLFVELIASPTCLLHVQTSNPCTLCASILTVSLLTLKTCITFSCRS